MDSLFSPSTPILILVTILIALVPIILHFSIFKSRAAASLPKFLVLGPSGSGKTALCLWFEKGPSASSIKTRKSQNPLSLECEVPSSICASSKYRSENDPSLQNEVKRFFLIDTPGHAKLRQFAFTEINKQKQIRGAIFVIDSADGLTIAAEYLHDVLLSLQQKRVSAGVKEKISFLVACNKSDLFTALPAGKIKVLLEKEITSVRESRAKGLRNSGVKGVDEVDADEEGEWLGEGGDGQFTFEMMEEVGVEVSVKSGSVEKGECEQWKQWLGSCL